MKNNDKFNSFEYSVISFIYYTIKRYIISIAVMGLLCWLYLTEMIQIGISREAGDDAFVAAVDIESFADQSLVELGSYDMVEVPQEKAENVSHFDGGRRERVETRRRTSRPASRQVSNRAVVFSGSVRDRQLAYIKTYSSIARDQMRKHGIPASITLAQGLLESNMGESRLAKENNNHFGIKCFSNSCKKGHCTNFSDDSHKDFFRKFDTVADSYHAHSALLKKPRYRALYQLSRNDYRGWAKGLKRAGYATDRSYDAKLIHLIENLELYKFDS